MKRYTTSLIALALVAGAIAQTPADTINRMVLVESTYNPIIAGAVKHSFIPEEVKPNVKKEAVSYADDTLPLTRFSRTAKKAEGVSTQEDKHLPGYAHLGIGNYTNLNGLAAYNLQFNDNNNIAFDAHLEGWNGKLKSNGEPWHSHLYDMGIGADYRLLMGKGELNAHIDATRYQYNYLTTSDYAGQTDLQASNRLNGALTLRGNIKEHLYYHVKAAYTHFGRNSHLTSKVRDVEGHLHAEMSVGLDMYEKGIASLLVHTDWINYAGIHHSNGFLAVGLTPQWEYKHADFLFNAGLNLDVNTHHKPWVQASPKCKISYLPDNIFSASLTLDGGRQLNTYTQLYELSPYWISTVPVRPSYTWLHSRLSAGLRIIEGLHLQLFGGYRITDNALFETVTDTLGTIYTGITTHNASEAYIGGDIEYAYKDLLSISASGTYHYWMLKDHIALLARAPKVDAQADARVRILNGLYAHTALRMRFFCPIAGQDTEKAIINWSLGARYALNRHITFFLDGHNLLNRHHSYYTGYPSQGISFMAGATFKF